jgi:NADH-quinone oxidoreductase subunit L
MNPALLTWIILFLPLGAAVLIALFTLRNPKLSATLSTSAVIAGFIFSIIFVAWAGWQPAAHESVANWLSVADLQIDFGLHFDPLSLLMMLVVTGVASAIHIYSWGYMYDDPGFARFFACLSLFTFSMLGIVLANNFVQLFIFWELVGVSSYLLVGFWFERPSAADAGKKAFITNRLGDFGFILGILTIWATFRSLNFESLHEAITAHPDAFGAGATLAGLLIFCGAMGKSAQFPLHVWLPDAMEGPTPVSALIHAATMVAAGVYMLCRVIFILDVPGSYALQIISWIGGFTALLMAIIALQQNDIKRILAYSTLSQLGYMVMSVGLRGPAESMFHLTTHAFFKALLFLGAGSVILACHHEQDIWKMGGLRRKMPVTYWTFMAGTLALCGLWPLSGFYSKDGILARAAEQNILLFILGVLVAMLTTFYMFRLVFVAFLGESRAEEAGQAHESPPVIGWPLRVLAVFSVIGAFIGVEQLYASQFNPGQGELETTIITKLFGPFTHAPLAAVLGLVAVLAGFAAAYGLYWKATKDPLPEKLGAVSRWMRNRFYFDELYEKTFIRAHNCLAAVAGWMDRVLIGGVVVRGTHGTTEFVGRALRLLQTGNLQTYAFLFALGVALVLFWALK